MTAIMNAMLPKLNFEQPPNTIAALTAALVLALDAPTEEQSERAVALADELATGMTAEDIEAAKAAAMEHFDG